MSNGNGSLVNVAMALIIILVAPAYINPLLAPINPPPIIEPPITPPPGDHTATYNPATWFGFAYPSASSTSGLRAKLEQAKPWGFTTVRLAVYFKSSIGLLKTDSQLFNEIDGMLSVLDEYGVKAIVDCHNYGTGLDLTKVGSPEWVAKWKAIVPHYANDGRIVAWELYNEPGARTFDDHLGGNSGSMTAVKVEKLMGEFYNLTVALRALDTLDRPVVWADYFFQDSPNSKFWGLSSSPLGRNYGGLSRVVLSAHPYSYGAESTWSGHQANIDYRLTKYAKNRAVYPYWIGELEGHDQQYGGSTTDALEYQYVEYWLSYGVDNGWGFNLWRYPTDDRRLSCDKMLTDIGFSP
jgi:hypothetical protein